MKPTFSLRAVLGVVLLAAMVSAWYASAMRRGEEFQRLAAHLRYAEEELRRARSELSDFRMAAKRKPQDKGRALYRATFLGMSVRSADLAGGDSAFQFTSFADCDLSAASLSGGIAAFQGARFDGAKLGGAKLSGANAAFQTASFVSANLAGARLSGGPGAFQGATFEGASLSGATIAILGDNYTAFQGVNVSGVDFRGANLEALHAESLKSCYFREAPLYNAKTKFPPQFDPMAAGWRRVK